MGSVASLAQMGARFHDDDAIVLEAQFKAHDVPLFDRDAPLAIGVEAVARKMLDKNGKWHG